MIQGKVLATREAVVRVHIRGTSGQTARVEAMVDTGFNDEMTMPPWVIEKLGLKFVTAGNYTLADGMQSAARIFAAEIEWLGTWRELYIVEIEGDPLLGMGVMERCNLTIDVIDGGRVEIRPLPAVPSAV